MLKLGVPEAAVRGKMSAEGFDADMYDKYLNPDTAITLNQQPPEESNLDNDNNSKENNQQNESEEKKEEIDLLDPNQPDIAPSNTNNNTQSKNPSSTGYFSSQNFVPEPDSGFPFSI